MDRREFAVKSLIAFSCAPRGLWNSLHLNQLEGPLTTTTYFVSSSRGKDQNDGRTPKSAWQTLARVNSAAIRPGDKILFRRNDLWRGTLRPKSGTTGHPVTYGAFGNGAKPVLAGSVAKDAPELWVMAQNNIWLTGLSDRRNDVTQQSGVIGVDGVLSSKNVVDFDVGNIIFDHGAACGVKKWRREDLLHNGDFWYEPERARVWLCMDELPTQRHRSIELALKRNIINEDGCQYVVYEDLHLRYGAAHGIGGSNTDHIVVRRCDISFIGGGHQYTRSDGLPVRFGNGIEFWDTAQNNLVEQCRVWDIYDAALTNQGKARNSEHANITYCDNIIWNAEYSFEYWNGPNTARTDTVTFEHNTCVDAGHGWGHGQRPDKNGHHLMFWRNTAATQKVSIRDNIFCNAADGCLRMENDWRSALALDFNLWFQQTGSMFIFLGKRFSACQIDAYRSASGFDFHSIIADPKFRNPLGHEYGLAPGSPGLHWTTNGLPCGAIHTAYDAPVKQH